MELMLLLIHIIVALASLASATVLFIKPRARGFYISYALVGTTLLSGTYLTVTSHAPLVQSCVTGLVYISVVSVAIYIAHNRFAGEIVSKSIDRS